MSFIFLGIYWNNHHHMFQTVDRVNGRILWANMHLLFWLSLVPFATGWMGENHFESLPTAAYGCVLLLAAVSYTILVYTIIAHQGAHSKLRAAIGNDKKGTISMVLYVAAIPLAFVHREIAWAIFVTVALIRFWIPAIPGQSRQWPQLKVPAAFADGTLASRRLARLRPRCRMGGLRKCWVTSKIRGVAGSAARTQPVQPARTPALHCVLKLTPTSPHNSRLHNAESRSRSVWPKVRAFQRSSVHSSEFFTSLSERRAQLGRDLWIEDRHADLLVDPKRARIEIR